MSDKTLEKVRAVTAVSEAEPEVFGDLPERMDATGKVDPVYRELERGLIEREAGSNPPAAEGPTEPERIALGSLIQGVAALEAAVSRLTLTPAAVDAVRRALARLTRVVGGAHVLRSPKPLDFPADSPPMRIAVALRDAIRPI